MIVASVFGDSLSLTIANSARSRASEGRFVTVGSSYPGRMLVVVHRDEGENIRIISARKATRRERKDYEEGM